MEAARKGSRRKGQRTAHDIANVNTRRDIRVSENRARRQPIMDVGLDA
jgi:hypothetical protein